MMDRAEREVEMQEVIEDDLPTVRKQSEELQVGRPSDFHSVMISTS